MMPIIGSLKGHFLGNFLDMINKFSVPGGKGKMIKFGKGNPTVLLGRSQFWRRGKNRRACSLLCSVSRMRDGWQNTVKAVENNLVVGVIMDGAGNFSGDADGKTGFFMKFSDKSLFR